MPTTDATFQTTIAVNGKIDEAILKSLQKLTSEMGKVVKQEKEVEKESKKSFDALGKGMDTATKKSKELALAMKDMLLPLLGISVAFKGFQTIGDTLQTAIDKFRGAREAAAAFKASIQDVVGKQKTSLFDTFFNTQSGRVLSRFSGKEGPIYGRGITRAIQDAFMHQHMQASNELIQAVIEKAVHSQGSLGITPEAVGEIATKWATFIKLPKGRVPQEMISELGLSGIKDLQAMSRAQKLALFGKEFGGMTDVEEMIKANPAIAELMGKQVQVNKALGETGGPLADLQTQGQIVSASLELAFLPVLKTIATAIDDNLKTPMDAVKGKVNDLNTEMKKIFTPSDADKKAGYSNDIFANMAKAWKEDILPELERDWEAFVKWASGTWANFGKMEYISPGVYVQHPMLQGLKEGAEALIAAAEKFGAINWEIMQSAAQQVGEAAKNLNDAVRSWKGIGGKIVNPTTPTGEPLPNTSAFATGGMVNSPQVGLVGEAGAESIIPLTRRDSNTLDILQGTFGALGINPLDPNAYGHELFDSGRMGLGSGYAPGGAGFSGNVGGVYYTEYGPSIDPPGSADYDYNSYHRIGAWPGITGMLTPGDVALGYGAQSFYGVHPGQTFMDTRGNTVRFADRSGSKNPMNEDVFRLAGGGIVSRKMLSWIGDAGKEAVIPLEGNKGRSALAGALNGAGGGSYHFSPTINVSGVATSEVVDDLVSELKRNFGRWMEDAHFEHERRAFS
jgi:hypothetical protein